jgi:hypothetical protein
MSTVSKIPVAPKVVSPKSNITSDQGANYGRPTSGGPPVAGKSEGNPNSSGAGVAPGVIPGAEAYRPNLAGNVDPNPTISGAAIVRPTSQPDATGHPAGDTSGGGTVGDSGPGLGQ